MQNVTRKLTETATSPSPCYGRQTPSSNGPGLTSCLYGKERSWTPALQHMAISVREQNGKASTTTQKSCTGKAGAPDRAQRHQPGGQTRVNRNSFAEFLPIKTSSGEQKQGQGVESHLNIQPTGAVCLHMLRPMSRFYRADPRL